MFSGVHLKQDRVSKSATAERRSKFSDGHPFFARGGNKERRRGWRERGEGRGRWLLQITTSGLFAGSREPESERAIELPFCGEREKGRIDARFCGAADERGREGGRAFLRVCAKMRRESGKGG